MTGRYPNRPSKGGPLPEDETHFELVTDEGATIPLPVPPRHSGAHPGQKMHGRRPLTGPSGHKPQITRPGPARALVDGQRSGPSARPTRPPTQQTPARPPLEKWRPLGPVLPGQLEKLPRTWAPPGRPPPPPRPWRETDPDLQQRARHRGRPLLPPKTPFTKGTYVGLLGKVLYLIALFLPWYSLMVTVDSGDYSTHGWVELVHIDGIRGVQINELLTGGHNPKGNTFLPIPISWLMLVFFIWSIFSIFTTRTARSRGWKFFRGGIVILVVFVILYFLITQLPNFIPSNSPVALRDLLDYIVAYPFLGNTSQDFGSWGKVHAQWGLQAGGFLLLVSALVQMLGGFMEWGSRKK